jgi:hypothetical protein
MLSFGHRSGCDAQAIHNGSDLRFRRFYLCFPPLPIRAAPSQKLGYVALG